MHWKYWALTALSYSGKMTQLILFIHEGRSKSPKLNAVKRDLVEHFFLLQHTVTSYKTRKNIQDIFFILKFTQRWVKCDRSKIWMGLKYRHTTLVYIYIYIYIYTRGSVKKLHTPHETTAVQPLPSYILDNHCNTNKEARVNSSVMFFYGPLHMVVPTLSGLQEPIYINTGCWLGHLFGWTTGTDGERQSGKSVLAARRDDDILLASPFDVFWQQWFCISFLLLSFNILARISWRFRFIIVVLFRVEFILSYGAEECLKIHAQTIVAWAHTKQCNSEVKPRKGYDHGVTIVKFSVDWTHPKVYISQVTRAVDEWYLKDQKYHSEDHPSLSLAIYIYIYIYIHTHTHIYIYIYNNEEEIWQLHHNPWAGKLSSIDGEWTDSINNVQDTQILHDESREMCKKKTRSTGLLYTRGQLHNLITAMQVSYLFFLNTNTHSHNHIHSYTHIHIHTYTH